MSETSFDHVITEHLTLAERNKRLNRAMPLDRYREHEEPAAEAATPATPLRDDPPSWWDTKDGECPPPPLWDDDE